MATKTAKLMPTQFNGGASHKPLRPGDTAAQTAGCRHTQPAVCTKNSAPKVCAFVRPDGVCLSPPKSWSGHFAKLKKKGGKR